MSTAPSAWHAGERALQERAGVAARMAQVGERFLRDHMPEQHRQFFPLLPFLLTGTLDDAGRPWASLLAGAPGFVSSPDPRRLRIAARALPHDPLGGHLRSGAPVGLLGLQAHTGRRNRMNGWITGVDAEGFEVTVGQSFGNCPKYIHPREAQAVPADGGGEASVLDGTQATALPWVQAADTCFIATAHPAARQGRDPAQGVDVSHRGGPPGFVRVEGEALVVPDFVGNTFFNTFGNLALEPRCSLLFIDYATGDRVHLRAQGAVEWTGSQRQLRLRVEDGLLVRGGLPLRWREPSAP